MENEDEEILSVDMDVYDQEEIYENCTVQVLTNTVTGKVSIGWWRNDIYEAGVEDIEEDYG